MNIYDFTVKDAQKEDVSLADYRGKVLLIVNTATACGFTPQYDGLEKLHADLHDKGLEILDFPCNQFANQAPGTNEEIVAFCQLKFGVTFKTFDKIDVNGKDAAPLFTFLKKEAKEHKSEEHTQLVTALKDKISGLLGSDIKWNFTKFLVDAEGNVIKRYSPTATPEKITPDIERLLSATAQ